MINISNLDKLVNTILNTAPVKADLIFAHGWGDLHDKSLEFLSQLYRESGAGSVLLNGIKEYEKGGVGFTEWKRKLSSFGIPPEAIVATQPALTTKEEAEGLANYLKDNKTDRAIVYSVPQHIARAFLTDLEALKKNNIDIKLFPVTLQKTNWEEQIVIKNLLNSEEDTTRLGRFAAECARISDYRERYERGEDFPIATVDQGIKHLETHI